MAQTYLFFDMWTGNEYDDVLPRDFFFSFGDDDKELSTVENGSICMNWTSMFEYHLWLPKKAEILKRNNNFIQFLQLKFIS
jgi:hypothetical protein